MLNQSHFYGADIRSAMRAARQGFREKPEYKKTSFDIVQQIDSKGCLLVGEGNLSFARSLLHFPQLSPSKIVATTFKRAAGLNEETLKNAEYIKAKGIAVLFGVNARHLGVALKCQKFARIIFQFPHTGRRRPVEGKNPNYILIRDFLNSAKQHLTSDGRVLISAVDNPHYQGAFQFENAAISAGYMVPLAYPFDPKRFKGYTHTMTHENGSALNTHKVFKTWVFVPKTSNL